MNFDRVIFPFLFTNCFFHFATGYSKLCSFTMKIGNKKTSNHNSFFSFFCSFSFFSFSFSFFIWLSDLWVCDCHTVANDATGTNVSFKKAEGGSHTHTLPRYLFVCFCPKLFNQNVSVKCARGKAWAAVLSVKMEHPLRKWTNLLIKNETEREICIFDMFLGYNKIAPRDLSHHRDTESQWSAEACQWLTWAPGQHLLLGYLVHQPDSS